MAYLYIIRDANTQTEIAHPSLRAARLAALSVKKGDILRVTLNDNLSGPQLRCALYNHQGFVGDPVVVATIDDGIARRVVSGGTDTDDEAEPAQ